MKILILGSKGMAGHVIHRYLDSKGFHVETAARSMANHYLDVENNDTVTKLVQKLPDFDFVINSIGLLVKDSISRPDRALLINSWFPQYLSHKLQSHKTKLIHLSTDCVFDGSRGWYNEDDLHTETNWYGKSKSLGEIKNNKDVTFRMSIIGPELKANGTGLYNFVYNNKDDCLSGWDNALWNGMTTLQLAKCLEQYISNPCHTGVYHLVNNDVYTNKYELIKSINQIFNCKKTIIQTQGPKNINKILINNSQSVQYPIPNYQQQLQELKDFYYTK